MRNPPSMRGGVWKVRLDADAEADDDGERRVHGGADANGRARGGLYLPNRLGSLASSHFFFATSNSSRVCFCPTALADRLPSFLPA